MPFQLSAGVIFNEQDISTIVPAVATTDGALAGVFRWGPVNKEVIIDSEAALVSRFGKPSNHNPETWFVGSSFLSYSNALHVVRAANTTGASPNVASAAVQSGNAIITVTSTNNMIAGTPYFVVATSNSIGGAANAIRIGAQASVLNSTAIQLSTSSDALLTLAGARIQLATNSAFTAFANTGYVPNLAGQIAINEEVFASKIDYDANVAITARFPGALGNSLRVAVCANVLGYSSNIALNTGLYGNTQSKVNFSVNSNTAIATLYTTDNTTISNVSNQFINDLNVGDVIQVGNSTIGFQTVKVSALSVANLAASNSTHGEASFTVSLQDVYRLSANVQYTGTDLSVNTFTRYWEFYNTVNGAPALSDFQINFGNNAVQSDEMHIVVVDDGGKFSGIPGTILEVFHNVSRATNAKTPSGSANYYKTVINTDSQYIYWINDIPGMVSNTASNLVAPTVDLVAYTMTQGNNGEDEINIPMTNLAAAYDKFGAETGTDISLIMTGKSRDGALSFQLGNYIIDNIAESRRDCVTFISPPQSAVVNNIGNEAAAVVAFRNNLRSSSYAVLDSGYKYMYDRYNDVYRWIPLNGDIAGLCARTDQTNDAWWSPGGLNRGQIKNVIKLSYNPRHTDRDNLYKNGVNPVITIPGQGTVLYGDKTLLAKPSAFNRINVRRLFIVLEKAIVAASQFTLFEFNDVFTRSQFKNLVVPFLRDVQGRRGIIAFDVVCDERNNTGQVIDANEFRAAMYIKPARSINFIGLNFVAVGTDVSFSEVENVSF